MNKEYSPKSMGVLSFLSFLGAGAILFVYLMGNMKPAVFMISALPLIALGGIGAAFALRGKGSPMMKTLLKGFFIIVTIALLVFIIQVVGLGINEG